MTNPEGSLDYTRYIRHDEKTARIEMRLTAALVSLVVTLLFVFLLTQAQATTSMAAQPVGLNGNAPSCPLAWSIVTVPSPGTGNILRAISARSADDIWIAGYHQGKDGTDTLIEHWDGTAWAIIPSVDVPGDPTYLEGIAAIAADDVWAVGRYSNESFIAVTLIEHWNGTAWSIVTSPNPGARDNEFFSVAALSASDVWAIGYQQAASGATQPLIEHWNGTTWAVVSSPVLPGFLIQLRSVDGVASNDVWAVGHYNNPTTQSLTEHWDGTSWTVVPTTDPAIATYHFSVDAVTANDVWIAGSSNQQTLTKHWDGTSWSIVPSPNFPNEPVNELYSISGLSSSDVWAVGYHGSPSPQAALIEHWDGTTWSIADAPGPDLGNLLERVAAISAQNVWAVGSAGGGSDVTLVEHYSTDCYISPTPTNSATTTPTVTATATAANTATGTPTGTTTNTPVSSVTNTATRTPTPVPSTTVISTPSSTASNTPTVIATGTPLSTATATATASTTPSNTAINTATNTPITLPTQTVGDPTATPEPTHCAIEFTDVVDGSTFYQFVQCMACRGIINGYTSGCETGNPCFRPNSNVTRGQLAKIVANAAGFNEAAGAQQYEDVAPGSTFFDFIWRLSSRGYVSGYPCGGVGEPCGSDNLPYFRPNSSATRGQISKIVSNAAGLSDPVGSQLFEDVAPGSSFYDFVQRLANEGAMSGYACGGPGEPCAPLNNRPYFRPANVATRGQTSKIVSNTFFPNCQTPARK